MKNKDDKAPQDYLLEGILAETKLMQKKESFPEKPTAEDDAALKDDSQINDKNRFGGKSYAELIGEAEDDIKPEAPPSQEPVVRPAPPAPIPEQPVQPQPPSPEISTPAMPEIPQPSQPTPNNGIRFEQKEQEELELKQPKKRRGFFGLFRDRHKDDVSLDEEDDVYYGMQLKPIDEYQKSYNLNTDSETNEQTGDQQTMHPTSTFAYLFDENSSDDIGDQIAARFEEIHKEHQNRIAKLAENNEAEKKIQPLYDYVKDTLNAVPKPAKKDTEKEIFSCSPNEQPKNTITVDINAQKSLEEKKPSVKSNQKKKNKEVTAQIATPKPVDNKKTTEFFVQIRPKKAIIVDPPKVEQPKLTEAIHKAPQLVEDKQVQSVMKPKTSVAEAIESVEPIMQKMSKKVSNSEPPLQEPSIIGELKEEETVSTEKAFDRKQRVKAVVEAAPKYLPFGNSMHFVQLDNLRAVVEIEAQKYATAEKAEPKEKTHVVQVQPRNTSVKPLEHSFEPKVEEQMHLPEDTPPKSKKKNRAIHKFNISGDEDGDDNPQEVLPEEPDEMEDYTDPADASSISLEMGASTRELLLRFTITGISTILLLAFGFLGEKYQILTYAVPFQISTVAYLILNISFLLITTAFCWKTVISGIKALITLQANSDSGVAVAAIAVLVQSVIAFFVPKYIMNGSIHLYSVLAAGALFLNTAGKLSMIKRINCNFRFISSPEPKNSVELYGDYNTSLQMAKGCVADTPVIAYQSKTKFLKNFLKNSYEPDPSEKASQTIAPVAFLCSLVLCIVCFILSKDITTAITVFAAAACVCTPATNMLSANLLIGSLCKFARKCGAMVVGYQTVEQFCNTNAVMLDAKDLFPKGTVVLNEIKTFGGQRIDEAIVDATALMCAVGGPLSDVFDQIIKSRRDMLPKIDNPVYEDERGVIGWVSGRRILIGNRDLMSKYGIEPPSRDYEEKYLLGGKQITYLASSGELVAMFVLSYNSDKRRALELQRMENNGISLIVRTCDPNMTPDFLATCFRLDIHSVRVLPECLGSMYKEIVGKELQDTTALLATKGRPTTMLRMLTACVRQKTNISLAVAMQNVAVVLGFVLVAFLACYSGLRQITTATLLVYEVFWLVVVLLIPRLRKP